MEDRPQPVEAPPVMKRHPLRRPGCVIGLILWFVLLLSPCFMILLAARGEISISTGDLPEQRIRVWLIQEARLSGIGVSSGAAQVYDQQMCVQTNVNFVLWRGQADPIQYCDCYTQAESGWQASSTESGACPTP